MRTCGTVTLILSFASAIAIAWSPRARAAGEASSGTSVHVLASVEAAPGFVRGGNPLWAVSLSELSATRDRPIFSVSRRPPAPPAVVTVAPPLKSVAKPQAPDHPPLVLIGTIIGDSLRIAIFIEEKTRNTVRLAIGEIREGWTLRSVGIGEARLENADRAETLALRPSTQVTMLGDPAPAMEEAPPPVRHRKR